MIGRRKELGIIRDCINADRSRLVVIYGRRRVGKTFLVREAFDYSFTFTHTGLEKVRYVEQLAEFWSSLKRQWRKDCPMPANWFEAFDLLKDAISESKDVRKTVFLDDIHTPWIRTRRP